MTALTASYLANESFKSSSLVPTVVNGTKPSKNQECKLEFVDGGILEPPPLPPNVIKLSPNEDLKNTSISDAASVSNSTTSSISLNNNNGNGSKSLKRKRQFSERFEKEAQHLVIEKQVSNLNSWDGCKFIKNSTALAGIRNPHNNCFLNSVLQAISHIPQFGRYILEHHVRSGPKCSGYDCMLCSLKAHILRGINWDVNDASWINKFFDDIFPSHQRGSQEDAHEMLLFLLDAIDRQQQKISRSQPGKISSIVEQVFDGKVRCEYTCMTCQKKSICYEPIRGLSVELPKQVDGNFASMSRIIKGFFNDERIAGYDCKQCKKKTVANKRTRVVTAPNVLIIQLKRFLRYSKINDLVLVCKELSLTDIMHNNDDASYKLLGYIRHIGGSMSSGHYTAVFTGFDGKPYVFDDEQRALSQVTFVKPLQPYILFYARNPSTNKSTTLIRSSSFQSPAKKQNYNGYNGNGNGNYSTPIKNNSLNMKNQILTPTKNENGHGNGNVGTFKTNSWTSAGFIGPIHPNKNGENSGTGFSMKITNGNRNIFNGKTNGIFKNENDIEKQNTNEKNDEEEKKEIAEKSPGNIENTNPNEENLKSNEKPPETSAIPESYFNFIKSQKPTKFVQD